MYIYILINKCWQREVEIDNKFKIIARLSILRRDVDIRDDIDSDMSLKELETYLILIEMRKAKQCQDHTTSDMKNT